MTREVMEQIQERIDAAQHRLNHLNIFRQVHSATGSQDQHILEKYDREIVRVEEILQTESAAAETIITSLQNQLSALTQSNMTLETDITSLREHLDHFNQEHNVTDEELPALLKIRTEQLEDLGRSIHELEQVPSQVGEAEERLKKQTSEIEQAKQNLAASEKQRDQEYSLLIGRLEIMDAKELAYLLAEIYKDETKDSLCQKIIELGFDANYLGHYAVEKNDFVLFEIALSYGLDFESCYNGKTIWQSISEYAHTQFIDFAFSRAIAEIDLDHTDITEILGDTTI